MSAAAVTVVVLDGDRVTMIMATLGSLWEWAGDTGMAGRRGWAGLPDSLLPPSPFLPRKLGLGWGVLKVKVRIRVRVRV